MQHGFLTLLCWHTDVDPQINSQKSQEEMYWTRKHDGEQKAPQRALPQEGPWARSQLQKAEIVRGWEMCVVLWLSATMVLSATTGRCSPTSAPGVLCFLLNLGALLSRQHGSHGLCLYYQVVKCKHLRTWLWISQERLLIWSIWPTGLSVH